MRAGIEIRAAVPADFTRIADLHVASWRVAYRGILTDAYLDGPVEAERAAVWQARMTDADPDRVVVIADDAGHLAAFACILAGHDARWGSLVDNLHVAPDRKGQGLGRRVLAHAAAAIPARWSDHPVHLTVLAANLAARSVYDRWGGRIVETTDKTEPDGMRHPVLRYSWTTPMALTACLAGRD